MIIYNAYKFGVDADLFCIRSELQRFFRPYFIAEQVGAVCAIVQKHLDDPEFIRRVETSGATERKDSSSNAQSNANGRDVNNNIAGNYKLDEVLQIIDDRYYGGIESFVRSGEVVMYDTSAPLWERSAVHESVHRTLREERDFHNQKCEVGFFVDPHDNSILCKLFFVQPSFVEDKRFFSELLSVINSLGGVDWHYEDHCNKPDDVSAEEWDKRRDSWERTVGDKWFSEAGIVFDLFPDFSSLSTEYNHAGGMGENSTHYFRYKRTLNDVKENGLHRFVYSPSSFIYSGGFREVGYCDGLFGFTEPDIEAITDALALLEDHNGIRKHSIPGTIGKSCEERLVDYGVSYVLADDEVKNWVDTCMMDDQLTGSIDSFYAIRNAVMNDELFIHDGLEYVDPIDYVALAAECSNRYEHIDKDISNVHDNQIEYHYACTIKVPVEILNGMLERVMNSILKEKKNNK